MRIFFSTTPLLNSLLTRSMIVISSCHAGSVPLRLQSARLRLVASIDFATAGFCFMSVALVAFELACACKAIVASILAGEYRAWEPGWIDAVPDKSMPFEICQFHSFGLTFGLSTLVVARFAKVFSLMLCQVINYH